MGTHINNWLALKKFSQRNNKSMVNNITYIFGFVCALTAFNYIYNRFTKNKISSLDSLCKNSTKWFKLLKLDRKQKNVHIPILHAELKSTDILSLPELKINDDDWYRIVKKDLIGEIMDFFNIVSEYWLGMVPYIEWNTPPPRHVNVIDSRNKIHFGAIDFLNRNQEYTNAIKKIYLKYKHCEVKKNTNNVLVNHLCNDVLEIISQYTIENQDNYLESFDKVIDDHSNNWDMHRRTIFRLDQ